MGGVMEIKYKNAKSGICLTHCKHRNELVGSVNCTKCCYFGGKNIKPKTVTCRHPEGELNGN
jgi:hypothetical protein